MSDLKLEYYMFDWDDNILYMPTVIHYVERRKDATGRPISVTTRELAADDDRPQGEKEYASGKFEVPADAFREFTDEGGDFVGDVARAIAYKGFGPSFESFKKALCDAALFAIVSARGHAPETIRAGVREFIERELSPAEIAAMKKAIGAWFERAGAGIPADDELLDAYLEGPNGYYGVTYQVDDDRPDIPKLKMNRIEEFVADKVKYADAFGQDGQKVPISFGFSDDDRRNIAGMKEGLDKLGIDYPDVEFFVYGYDDNGSWERLEVLSHGART